jgi:hypothetical protein
MQNPSTVYAIQSKYTHIYNFHAKRIIWMGTGRRIQIYAIQYCGNSVIDGQSRKNGVTGREKKNYAGCAS